MTLLIGALLPLAFAPLGWYLLALIIPGLYEKYVFQSKHPARTGFLFGLGFFGVGVSWVYVSIHDYSDTPQILALLITAGFVCALATVLACSAWIYRRLKPTTLTQRLMIFPALWALTEAFRGWFLTGFPWLYLGDTAVDSVLRDYLPIMGVFGVSWLIVLTSMIIMQLRIQPYWPKFISLFCIATLGYGLSQISWTKPTGDTYQVSLIQGNIPQLLKWDPEQANAHFEVYYDLTKSVIDSDIIIWPEATLPVPMPYATPYMDALIALTEQHHNALLIGELYSAGEEGFLNSAQAVGDGSHRYDKKHLVPFGEYLPFYDQLGPILEDLRLPTPTTIPGTSDQIPLKLKKWQAAVMICYEIAYPMLTLNSAQDSNVLITISNDTWFGNSIGPQQHFQIARTRAIEAGRYLIRATNNGITGFIGPDGQILSQAPQFVATTLTGTVPGMQGRTPLMIYGHLTILLLLLLMVAISSRQTLK
jgi:apolipoprotein N-acyltransferase